MTVTVAGKDADLPFVIGAGDPAEDAPARAGLQVVDRRDQAGDPADADPAADLLVPQSTKS